MNLLSLIKNCRVDPVLKDLGDFKLLVGWQRKPGSRKANDRTGAPRIWTIKEPRPWQAPRAVQKLTEGAQRIVAERKRQREVEGWSPEHDDTHTDSSLAQVGACYVAAATLLELGKSLEEVKCLGGPEMFGRMWPKDWDPAWWKPTDALRCREKAGALFWAEADRLKRRHEVGAQFVRLLDLVDGQAAAIDRLLAAEKIAAEKAAAVPELAKVPARIVGPNEVPAELGGAK